MPAIPSRFLSQTLLCFSTCSLCNQSLFSSLLSPLLQFFTTINHQPTQPILLQSQINIPISPAITEIQICRLSAPPQVSLPRRFESLLSLSPSRHLRRDAVPAPHCQQIPLIHRWRRSKSLSTAIDPRATSPCSPLHHSVSTATTGFQSPLSSSPRHLRPSPSLLFTAGRHHRSTRPCVPQIQCAGSSHPSHRRPSLLCRTFSARPRHRCRRRSTSASKFTAPSVSHGQPLSLRRNRKEGN